MPLDPRTLDAAVLEARRELLEARINLRVAQLRVMAARILTSPRVTVDPRWPEPGRAVNLLRRRGPVS
jgi:sensor domain CHASE-containing protein